MIKVIKLKTIKKIIFIIAVIILITAIFKWTNSVYLNLKNEYKILIDVEDSKLFLLENNKLLKTYKCSGGKWGTPSPIGTWEITFKSKWGEGFGGSFLGLNVPWGKFGIHGTLNQNSLGWSSSHGCIRMDNKDVAELYKMVPVGTSVVIVDGVYGPFGKGLRVLKSGMYGADVLEIQKRLKELGFFNNTPNGKFGVETENSVVNYCKSYGLYKRKIIDINLQKHLGFELID